MNIHYQRPQRAETKEYPCLYFFPEPTRIGLIENEHEYVIRPYCSVQRAINVQEGMLRYLDEVVDVISQTKIEGSATVRYYIYRAMLIEEERQEHLSGKVIGNMLLPRIDLDGTNNEEGTIEFAFGSQTCFQGPIFIGRTARAIFKEHQDKLVRAFLKYCNDNFIEALSLRKE